MDDIERQQINKIVPLGWYYLRLNEFVDRNDLFYLMSVHGGGGIDSDPHGGDNSSSNQEIDPDKRYGKRYFLKQNIFNADLRSTNCHSKFNFSIFIQLAFLAS